MLHLARLVGPHLQSSLHSNFRTIIIPRTGRLHPTSTCMTPGSLTRSRHLSQSSSYSTYSPTCTDTQAKSNPFFPPTSPSHPAQSTSSYPASPAPSSPVPALYPSVGSPRPYSPSPPLLISYLKHLPTSAPTSPASKMPISPLSHQSMTSSTCRYRLRGTKREGRWEGRERRRKGGQRGWAGVCRMRRA